MASFNGQRKSIAILSIAPLFSLLLVLVPTAYAANITVVDISGHLSGDFLATVRAHASGTPSSLSGGGTDTPPPNVPIQPKFNPGVCQFPLTGSITGTTVTLSGTVTQSSLPSLIGLPVTITADTSTGFITFHIGPFTVSGTGTVVINSG